MLPSRYGVVSQYIIYQFQLIIRINKHIVQYLFRLTFFPSFTFKKSRFASRTSSVGKIVRKKERKKIIQLREFYACLSEILCNNGGVYPFCAGCCFHNI